MIENETKIDDERHTFETIDDKKPNYTLRRFAGAAFTLLALAGAGIGIGYAAAPRVEIARQGITVPAGGTIQESVRGAVNNMGEQYDISPDKIRNDEIVYESQHAGRETEGVTQPGDKFRVIIEDHKWYESPSGDYGLRIEPVEDKTE